MELHLSSKPRLHKRPESDIAIIVPVIEPVHATTLRHTMIDQSINLLSRRSRQRERLYAKGLCICLSVCLSVCRQNAYTEMRFSQKSSNIQLGLYWRAIGSPTWAIQRTHYWTPTIQDGGEKSRNSHISTKHHPISIKFSRKQHITRWQSHDQIWTFLKFKMADGRHLKNCFGHNSAAACPILVNFCAGKHNSMAIVVTWHKL